MHSPRRADGASSPPLKIVITGPFESGKTTLIETISEIAVVGTERSVTGRPRGVKPHTTVAMDFGRITFADGASLFLFGTPGQRRFEVMWEVLAEGMIGFILLVNATSAQSRADARGILETFHRYADVPHVVGVTHLDALEEGDRPSILDAVRAELALSDDVAVMASDVRKKDDVKELLLALLFGVMSRLDTASAAAG
jgi:uncharacterized protein